jgi:hypothetical protein
MIFHISSSLSTPPNAAGMVCCGISFDQLEQGEIITAKFPFVVEEGWAHATTATPWQTEQPV